MARDDVSLVNRPHRDGDGATWKFNGAVARLLIVRPPTDNDFMSKAPRLVYFDRSAWADLVRDQDAGGDATNRLLRAVTSNRVKFAISDAVVDEPLPLLAQSIAIGARHLALLLSLADWKKGVVKMPKDLMRDEALAARDGKGRPTSFRRIPGWMAQSGVLDGLYVVKTDHRRHGGGPQKEDEAGTHFQKGVL